MKVLHLNAGAETGGGMIHILSLLNELNRDEMILGLFEEGVMFQKALALGIETQVFSQSSRYDASIVKNIVKFMKDKKVDIIHTHGPRANLYGLILSKITKCKWVTTVHSDPRDDFRGGGIKGKIFTKINLRALKYPQHYFAISKHFKSMLVNFGIDERKITTIYNGIDFKTPLPENLTRNEIGLSSDDFVMIMVARLHPVKCHHMVLTVLERVLKQYPNIKLLLIGEGPIKDELVQQVEQKGIQKNVKFLGHQEDVHSFYCLADIKLLTSYSESFPLVILEAARAHIPVISTDVGGVKDLISDDSLGWVIDVEDSAALEQSIRSAIQLKKTGQLGILGENLYKKASTKYSIEQFSDSVYNAYKKIL